MITDQTMDLIHNVLESTLGTWNYMGFEAETRTDTDGDPAIFVTARFVNDEIPPSEATTKAMVALLDRLRATGDERIPYLDYVYPDWDIEGEAA